MLHVRCIFRLRRLFNCLMMVLLLSACSGSNNNSGDDENQPPTIAGIPALIIVHGVNYSFVPTANDPDGDTLTFSIVNKPSWASFDIQTGELSGIPEASDIGDFSNIVISVTDGTESALLPTFAIRVIPLASDSLTL